MLHAASRKGSGAEKWWCCAGLMIISALLTWWPQGLDTWRYDRAAVASGQFWRLLTGHLVHIGPMHLAQNLFGLVLVVDLLWRCLRPVHGLALFMTSVAVIDLVLWLCYPDVIWYAGLSGSLHGLWAGCALISLGETALRSRRQACVQASVTARCAPYLVSVVALIFLAAKLWLEYGRGPVGDAGRSDGAAIVFAAHWIGAAAGSCYGLAWLCVAWRRSKTRARKDFAGDLH